VRSYLFLRAIFGVALLIGFMGILATLATPKKAEAQKPADKLVKQVDKTQPNGVAGPRTTLLMVRTATCMQQGDVIATFRRGLDVSKCIVTGHISVVPASPSLMGLFDKRPTWTRPAATQCIEGITISPVQDKENHLRFVLKDNTENLQQLEITYRRSGARTYQPEVDGDLQLESTGRYILKAQPQDEPLRFTATLVRNDKKRTVTEPFPTWERAFMVVLPQFSGDLRQLFAVVRDPSKVPNAFDELREGPVVTMALVDLDSGDVPMGDTWDKNDYIPVVSALSKRKVKRAWVRFPLTQTEANDSLASYRKLTTKQISQVIRKDAVSIDAKNRSVAPDSKPQWFELASSEGGSRFLCRIPIKDVKGLYKKYNRLYRLLVYEFDDGSAPEAILVTDKPGCCKAPVVMQEVNR